MYRNSQSILNIQYPWHINFLNKADIFKNYLKGTFWLRTQPVDATLYLKM